MLPINQWPKEDRPREKLWRLGEHKLTTTELLAILLRTGTKNCSALDVAKNILKKFKSLRNIGRASLSDWKSIKGLGEAKIAQIKAALEIGRRLGEEKLRERHTRLDSSSDVVELLMPRMRDLKKETVKVLLMDSQNRLMDVIEAEEGTVNFSNPIIREILEPAIVQGAASLICVHNHPSGDPTPSPEDNHFTQSLAEAARYLHINLLDHIIIGDNQYYSFADQGVLRVD